MLAISSGKKVVAAAQPCTTVPLILLLVLLSSSCCWQAAEAQTPTTSAAGTSTALSTTAVPGSSSSSPTPVPSPGGLFAGAQSRADLIFTFFGQDETSVGEYRRTIADLVNVSVGRVIFESTGSGRYGYLFGNDVRARVIVEPPTEAGQPSARTIRDAIVGLAVQQDSRLTDIGVQSGEPVDDLHVYTYSPITVWDVAWTLLIVAGSVGFLGFVGFVGFRFHNSIKFARRERAQQAKDKELENLKRQAASRQADGNTKDAAAVPRNTNLLAAYDDDDDGEAGEAAMASLVDELARSIKRQQQQAAGGGSHQAGAEFYGTASSGGSDSGLASPYNSVGRAAAAGGRGTTATESEAFTAPTDRLPGVGGNALGPTGIQGRDALGLHAHAAAAQPRASGVHAYLETVLLPPVTAPATYLAGVDDPSLAPKGDASTSPTVASGQRRNSPHNQQHHYHASSNGTGLSPHHPSSPVATGGNNFAGFTSSSSNSQLSPRSRIARIDAADL